MLHEPFNLFIDWFRGSYLSGLLGIITNNRDTRLPISVYKKGCFESSGNQSHGWEIPELWTYTRFAQKISHGFLCKFETRSMKMSQVFKHPFTMGVWSEPVLRGQKIMMRLIPKVSVDVFCSHVGLPGPAPFWTSERQKIQRWLIGFE